MFDVIPLSYPLVVIPIVILLFLGFCQSPFSYFKIVQLFELWFSQLPNAYTRTLYFSATHVCLQPCPSRTCQFVLPTLELSD